MSNEATMTDRDTALSEMCRGALYAQNACNLSGVVHSMSRVLSELRDMYPEAGTAFFNANPISALYATQIGHLTKMSAMSDPVTYGWCYQWADDCRGGNHPDVRTKTGKQVGIVAFTALLHHRDLGGDNLGSTLSDLEDHGEYWGIFRNNMFYGIEKTSGVIHT